MTTLEKIQRAKQLKAAFSNLWESEDLALFDYAVKALEQEPKWIPVSERLPEDDGLYLVYTEEQPFVCTFENGEFFIDEVKAWMPLPEPYEKGGE